MSNCILRKIGTEGDKTRYKCKECGRPLAVASSVPVERIRRQCSHDEPAASPDVIAACIHRGAPTGLEHVCELCGTRGKMEPVYECALHGVCTVRRWTLTPQKQPERACIRCEDLTLDDGSQPLKQPSRRLD